MTTSKLPAYTYNSTSVMKNSRKVDIDIDSICEDLYKCVADRNKFKQIMDNIQEEIFSEEKGGKAHTLNSQATVLNQPVGNSFANPSFNNPMFSLSNANNPNVLRFKSTIPDGEMITPGPYQEKVQHKKYTDVNANSNYYYPKQENNIHDTTRSQWTNRANRIMYDSQSNWHNNDRKVQSPLSSSSQNSMYHNNNNTVMLGSIMSKPNY